MSRQTDLQAFAEYWLRRPLTAVDAVAVPPFLRMPAALREIYETFGGCAPLTQPFNTLLLPDKIEAADGYSIFYAENQCVAYWAFKTEEAGADDPMVYQSLDSNSGLFWTPEEMSIFEWIRWMALWQLVSGGYPHCAYASGIPKATEIVSSLYPEVSRHPVEHRRFFGKEGALICLAGSKSIPSVWAAASDRSAFETLTERLDFEWNSDPL